uniref:PHD finger protein 10 n=2 Tax=Mesocestoides corti TaxID=53468 RepID=A0A5K3EYK0_MESCO
MLTANGSVGPPPSSTTALLTVNGIIPNQQMSAQQTGRPTPILTPAFFPNTAFASFPVPFSGSTSVLPCIASPQTGTLFQGPGGQFPFNMTGSMLVAQPQPVLNGTPINFSSFNQPGSVSNASPPVTATVVLTAPITSDVCLTSNASLSVIQNGTTSITTSTTSLAPTFNAGAVESTPPIKCKPEVKPVVPTTSVISTNTNPEASLASLEKSDFHRGLILEAIDKLRDRKARPDLERISCLLRRQHNISPSETQLCLSRLAENGSVVCVDYKGNMSYRNPSKWRKTAASAVGITNRPHISRRILEAIRSLIPEGGDTTQGFSIFQIEQAIKQLTPATPPSGDADSEQGAASTPELTGPALRICLDREATYGKLAKLVDGRYVLDETGDRKRTSVAAFHLNRRPFAGKLPTHGTFGKPPIAPALDSINGKTHGVLSIAPGRPIARRLPFPGGKRGRPPSIKAKKILTSCSQQPILPAPPDNLMTALDKRLKLEAVPVTAPTATFVPLDGTVMVSATPMPTLSLAPPAPPPPAPGGSAPPPTAMLMYPGLYNPTVFTVTPEAMVTASFQPDANATAAALTTSTPDSCLVTPDQVSLTSSFAEPTVTEVETSKKVETEISGMTSVCCRCQQSATEEKFLVCSECGLQAHPRCLEFWPEVTERARQEVWQCADCKSCSVCKNKEVGGLILICDACDKGFHATCHNPAVPADTDQSLPWICSACQAEGYRVQTSNPSACSPRPSSGDAGTTAVVTTAVAELGPPAEGTTPACQNQPPVSDTAGSQTPGNCEVSEESVSTTPAVSAKEPEVGHPPEEASPARSHLEEEDYLPPNLGTPQHEFSAPELHLTATRPADVKLWTVDQVAEWLREQGAFDKEAEAFRQQDIDGACLMLLKRMSVLTDVGIKLGPAVKIFDRIKRLQSLQQQLESTEG